MRRQRPPRVYDCLLPGDERADLVDAPLAFLEALDGKSLHRRLGHGVFGLADGLQIAFDLCEPLAELHRKGLAHGRLEPLMVFIEGESPPRARLASFGPGGLPRFPYWPADGNAASPTPADDVYALGMMLTRMWLPPDAWTDDPSAARAAPTERQRALLGAMLAPRATRLRDAAAVLDALQPLRLDAEIDNDSISLEMPLRHAVPAARAQTSPGARRPWLIVAVILLIAGAAGWWTQRDPSSTPSEAEPTGRVVDRALDDAPLSARSTGVAAAADPSAPATSARGGAVIERATFTDAAADSAGPDAAAPDAAMPDAAVPDARPPDAAPDTTLAVEAVRWPELPARSGPLMPLRRTVPAGDGDWLYASRREITRGDWRRIAGRLPGLGADRPDEPMVDITAGQAAWFCNELSDREGLDQCYADCPDPARCAEIPAPRRPCTGYRLPTRDEWQSIALRLDRAEARRRARRLRLGAPACRSIDRLDLCDFYGGVWEWTETARRHRGRRTAFRMGGSWDPGHRDVFDEAYQHVMGNPQPFVGVRPVRIAADPRVRIGGLTYDPLARQVSRGDRVASLERDAAVLFERLVRNEGRLPSAGTSAAIRSGLGATLAGLGARIRFEGAQVVLSPPK